MILGDLFFFFFIGPNLRYAVIIKVEIDLFLLVIHIISVNK